MKRNFLLGIALAVLLLGCGGRNVDIEIGDPPASRAGENSELTAGAAKINITPPPGMPIAGFSVMSSYARGVRTGLMSRVIYLNPAKGRSVALVQCDLLSGSSIVREKVAELVAGQTDLDSRGILMAGTHTHSGPGNFFGSKLFNDHASNDSGFSMEYFLFLSQRIAKAVVDAYENRRPAKIATGSTRIEENVTQNRSFQAYLENRNVNASRATKYNAVNPYMHMLRVDCLDKDGTYKPLGAFSNFSLHPNTKPELLGALYNGDIFAYIEREVEYGIQKQYQTSWEPVHAAANYVHGDNNPNYSGKENFRELERIGRIVGKEALQLFNSLQDGLKRDAKIQLRAKEVDMLQDKSKAGYKICDPKLGNAQLAGAGGEDKHTLLYYIPLFAPGWPMDTGTCQGAKREALGPLQYVYVEKDEFPHNLFLQVIRIDGFVYTPLPFEITCEMGKRIAEINMTRAKQEGLKGVDTFIPVSCSNGYFGYVNTPEEYSVQYYEGGSNLYGPQTGYYLAFHLNDLVAGLAGENIELELIANKSYDVEVKRHYPVERNPKGERETVRAPKFHEYCEQGKPYYSFRWYDVPPDKIALHKGLIQIEYSGSGEKWQVLRKNGRKVDDTSRDIAIIYLDELNEDNMGLYEARWYAGEHEPGRFRFTVLPRKGREEFNSAAFQVHAQ